MTSPNRGALAFLVLLTLNPAWAGLGDFESSIQEEKVKMHARHSVAVKPQYSVHDLQNSDGAHIQQYVGSDGRVFAVVWHTLFKPDLSSILGGSYPAYAQSARESARKGGIQRRFRHESLDLVVQATAHLNVFSGYAFRQSMLPSGFSLSTIVLE
ncbi:MAG: DUF2844 domain-containing protein [Burkholderiales bacterium]